MLKTLPKWVGAIATLRQSANWRALFGGFPPLARAVHSEPTLMQKGLFFMGKLQEMSSGHVKLTLRGK